MGFERISVDPEIMAGTPCVAGTRIPVATVVGMLAEGADTGQVLEEFPQLDAADVRAALAFAAAAVDERTRPLKPV